MKYKLSLWLNPKSEYWYAQIYLNGQATKQRKRLGTKDESVAKNRLSVLESSGEAKLWAQKLATTKKGKEKVPGAGIRLDDMAEWYIHTHLRSLNRADKTIRQYHRVLRDLIVYCRSRNVGRLDQLSSRIVQDWQAWLAAVRSDGKERPVRRDELLIVRAFVNEAAEMHDIDPPRIRWNIPRKGTESRFKSLSHADLAAFLEMIRTKTRGVYDVVLWLAITGWRSGDVLGLQWVEIGDTSIRRRQVKSKRMLEFPITPGMQEILDRQPKTGPKVFNIEYTTLKKKMEYACSKHFHRNVSPRDLRKTYGTLQAARRCPPEILRELMGHATVEMTLQYYVETSFDAISAEACVYEKSIIS